MIVVVLSVIFVIFVIFVILLLIIIVIIIIIYYYHHYYYYHHGGRDYELIVLSCVVAEDSRYLYGQVRELAQLRGEDDFELRGSTLEQPEKDIVDAMKKCSFEHTPPPVCLGSKSGNLGHRFQAMVHSLS